MKEALEHGSAVEFFKNAALFYQIDTKLLGRLYLLDSASKPAALLAISDVVILKADISCVYLFHATNNLAQRGIFKSDLVSCKKNLIEMCITQTIVFQLEHGPAIPARL